MLADRLRQNQVDNSPNALGLTNVTSVEKSTVTTSNTVTVSGLAGPTAISITNGEYSKNAAAYTTASGTITNGDTLTLRHTSSSSYLTATVTTVQVGASVSTWSSTTRAQDTTPNVFSFSPVTGAERSTVQTSTLITFSGVDTDVVAAVSVSGGFYSKNSAAYTSAAGTAVNGDTFRVQHTSSASFTTTVETILTIGSQSASFTSQTRALDTTPNAFSFTAVTGATPSTLYTSNTITLAGMGSGDTASVSIVGGTYSKNGAGYTTASTTAVNGDTFAVQVAASSSFSTAATATLTIGGVAGSYQVTTRAADTTPDAFSFTPRTNATPSTTYLSSNSITVSGLDTGVSVAVSISGGSYSKNGGTLTTASGTAVNGDTFQVTHTASSSPSTLSWSTLTIGGILANFEVTTRAPDTVPNAFSFTDLTNQACNSEVVSSSITISGLDTGYGSTITLSGTGSSWRKNGGAWFAAGIGGVVYNGDTVQLRFVTDNTLNKTWSCTPTIGGATDTWTVVTGNDATPTAWAWTDLTGVVAGAVYVSDAYTVSGLTPGYRAVVACSSLPELNGGFKINDGATIYMGTTSQAANGDTVRAVITASVVPGGSAGVEVGVGTISDVWFVTTAP